MVFKFLSIFLTIVVIGNAQNSKDYLIYQGTKMPRNYHANFKPEVRQTIDPGFDGHEQSKNDPSEGFVWNMDDHDDVDEVKNQLLGSPHHPHPKWNPLPIKNGYANSFPQETTKNEAFGSIDFGHQMHAMMNGDEGKATKRNQV